MNKTRNLLFVLALAAASFVVVGCGSSEDADAYKPAASATPNKFRQETDTANGTATEQKGGASSSASGL